MVERGKIGYILSSLAISVAFLAIATTPTIGYELSIYRDTPLAFWVFLLISIIIGTYLLTQGYLLSGFVFISIPIIAITALPILKGYFFLGGWSDPPSHLGAVKDISAGNIQLANEPYVLLYTLVLVISEVLGITIRTTMLLSIPVFITIFLLSTPVIVRQFAPQHGFMVGTLSAAMLLPINNIEVVLYPRPTDTALFFALFPVFCLAIYSRSNETWSIIPLLISILALLLAHPLHALLLLVTILSIGILLNIEWILSYNKLHRTFIVIPIIFAILFWIWVQRSPVVFATLASFLKSLLLSSGASPEMVSRADSLLSVIGYSIEYLFVTIFGRLLPFILATACLAIVGVWNLYMDDYELQFGSALAIGSGVIGAISIIYMVVGSSTLHFRMIGFAALLATVSGAIAFAKLQAKSRIWLKRSIPVLLVVLLLLSVPVMWPSPYVLKASPHLPEGQMSGYEHSFEYRDDIDMIHMYDAAFRYRAAIYGQKRAREGLGIEATIDIIGQPKTKVTPGQSLYNKVPYHFANQNLSGYYLGPRYLSVTAADRERSLDLYNGVRYNKYDFRYLEESKDIQKVYANSQYTWYLIN